VLIFVCVIVLGAPSWVPELHSEFKENPNCHVLFTQTFVYTDYQPDVIRSRRVGKSRPRD